MFTSFSGLLRKPPVRTAFNRLLLGMSKGDVEKLVSIMFNINSRYAKDAVMQAQSIINSQKELVKQHFMEKERAIKELRKKVENIKNGAIGVDINPDGIALTEISSCGNFVSSSWYSLPELTYSSKNRRENLIDETAAEIVKIALAKGKGLVIESLHFVKKKKGKQFNRISHNFVYRRLLEAIERQATKCGVTIKQVNPAYTSIIGKYKYATSLGLSFHQAAALVIARRGLGFRERISKKIQLLISVLISKLSSLLSAMEAKSKREVKRLLAKLKNWRNLHSWSFWHTFNQSLRKVGVKPWLLGDFNGFLSA